MPAQQGVGTVMKRTSVTLSSRVARARIVRGLAVGTGLALLPIASAVAQSLPQGLMSPGSSDLQRVVQQAISTNPEVQAAWRELRASGQDRRAAWGNYLPSVDVNAGVGQEDREHDGRGSYDTDYAEVALTQMIYDGFATSSEVERLDRAELVRYYELLGASEEVSLEAVRAYLDVQRYRELVRLAQDNYAKHLEVFNQIEERTLSGAGRGVDLEQISGRLALAESNLMTEASNLHDVTARYQRIVGDLPATCRRPRWRRRRTSPVACPPMWRRRWIWPSRAIPSSMPPSRTSRPLGRHGAASAPLSIRPSTWSLAPAPTRIATAVPSTTSTSVRTAAASSWWRA